MINLYFLIAAATAQIFDTISELIMPTVFSTDQGNAEIEAQPLIGGMKIRICLE